MKMDFSKGFKQFALKTLIFVILFIVYSFIMGEKVVGSNMLYGFDLFIYGGMGYILLFSIVGFSLLYRKKIVKLKPTKNKLYDYVILVVSFILLYFFNLVAIKSNKIQETIGNEIIIHFLFLLTLITLVLGIYGLDFIRNFFKKFKKEIVYFLIFGIIAYSLMNQVWKLWPYFSAIVTKVVYFMLKQISSDVKLVGSDTLVFGNFGAKIAEACSGVFSIFIFTALYIFVALVDWKKLNKKKIIGLFIPAVLGAFVINILRVFSLMVIGNYVSKEAALGLYHSYTGMIFFLIYFVVFWFFAYKWMKK